MRSFLARIPAVEGAVGVALVAGGLYLRFGVWVALLTVGVGMLVDAGLRGRS